MIDASMLERKRYGRNPVQKVNADLQANERAGRRHHADRFEPWTIRIIAVDQLHNAEGHGDAPDGTEYKPDTLMKPIITGRKNVKKVKHANA